MKSTLFALAALFVVTPATAHYDAKPPSIAGDYTCATPSGHVAFHMTLNANNQGHVHGSGGSSVNWLDGNGIVLVVRANDESRVVAYFNFWTGNAFIPDRVTLVPAICAAGLADML